VFSDHYLVFCHYFSPCGGKIRAMQNHFGHPDYFWTYQDLQISW